MLNRHEFIGVVTLIFAWAGLAGSSISAERSLKLTGNRVTVEIQADLSLHVHRNSGELLWTTSQDLKPTGIVAPADSNEKEEQTVNLHDAGRRQDEPFDDGDHRGYLIRLSDFSETDVEISLVLALDAASDELLLEVQQTGGQDRLKQVDHLYRLEKPTSDGGYLVVPHGSGYLIPADCPKDLAPYDDYFRKRGTMGGNSRRSKNIIGFRYTLPVFGMVKGNDCFYQIVESWWDCSVDVEHLPGDRSSLDFKWLPSLGELRYPRRCLLRFAEGMDHVGIAKVYRAHARKTGLLRTLEEKAEETPAIRRYVNGIEYRVLWRPDVDKKALVDIRNFRSRGMPLNLFFPKWDSQTYDPASRKPWNAHAGWQSCLMQEIPVPGGWQRLVRFSRAAKIEGAVVKVMINPNRHVANAPGYDATRRGLDHDGATLGWPGISPCFAQDVTKQALDSLMLQGFQLDALYLDGYSAHVGMSEDYSPDHPVSRRKAIESMVASFRETRSRGIMPGAELPRFWAMRDCDFFYFRSGWSSDILAIGEPIPLYQLVFHECYAGCFSGGGYGRYDWPKEMQPRLYELLMAAQPAYNWMLPYDDVHPGKGFTEVPVPDWESPRLKPRLDWLKRWHSFYRSIALSEMVSHQFLSEDRMLQRVEYANGVTAEFDLAKGLCRVQGVEGFNGNWEKPHEGTL